MPKSQKESTPDPKPAKGFYLAQLCIKDIKEVLAHFENEQRLEIADHLRQTFEEISDYYNTNNDKIFENFRKREDDLMIRYGRAIKIYQERYFRTLFSFSVLLSEKGYYTYEEYHALKNEEYLLSAEDISEWVHRVLKFLHADRYYFYLERKTEFEMETFKKLSGTLEEKDTDSTEARQLLAIYYLLKTGFGIEHRKNTDISDVARLAHLLLGKKFTTLQKSTIYDKYKTMPNYKNNEYLIEDLKYIKPYFEKVDMQKAVDLINKEIEKTIQGLPPSKRKDYR